MRPEGWFEKLKAVVAAHEKATWIRGKRDCGTFAADCLVAIGCVDPVKDLRGRYNSRIDLLKLFDAMGYRGPEGFLDEWATRRNYPEIPPQFAQCGDLGITSNGTACIRMPAGFIALGETGGLGLVNPSKAWAIEWA